MKELEFLEKQNVSPELIKRAEEFRQAYPVKDEVAGRIIRPSIPFYGKEILEMAIAAILQGQNLLLTGRRQPERIFWLRIWHIFLTVRPTMYPFM